MDQFGRSKYHFCRWLERQILEYWPRDLIGIVVEYTLCEGIGLILWDGSTCLEMSKAIIDNRIANNSTACKLNVADPRSVHFWIGGSTSHINSIKKLNAKVLLIDHNLPIPLFIRMDGEFEPLLQSQRRLTKYQIDVLYGTEPVEPRLCIKTSKEVRIKRFHHRDCKNSQQSRVFRLKLPKAAQGPNSRMCVVNGAVYIFGNQSRCHMLDLENRCWITIYSTTIFSEFGSKHTVIVPNNLFCNSSDEVVGGNGADESSVLCFNQQNGLWNVDRFDLATATVCGLYYSLPSELIDHIVGVHVIESFYLVVVGYKRKLSRGTIIIATELRQFCTGPWYPAAAMLEGREAFIPSWHHVGTYDGGIADDTVSVVVM